MNFSRIACLSDPLQVSRVTSESFFDLVREPIRQGSGIDIGHSPGEKKRHGLLPTFDLQQFRHLAAQEQSISLPTLWTMTYHRMPVTAQDYLFSHIPDDTLLLSCDIPPWLRQQCLARNIPFIDLRHAPLGFGRDMFIAIDTSVSTLRLRIAKQQVGEEELRLEAALLAANIRAHRRRLEETSRYNFNLDDCLIIVGQHPDSAALIGSQGQKQTFPEFANELRQLAQGRRVLHLPDFGEDHFTFPAPAEVQRAELSELIGTAVLPCLQNSYQILSSEDDVTLTGISAGLLQEAAWFDKPAHPLSASFTPMAHGHDFAAAGYAAIRFQDLIAPAFWHQILTPSSAPPRLSRLPLLSRHHARETLDVWGDYEKVLSWERTLPYQFFERSGGGVLRQKLATMEKSPTPVKHTDTYSKTSAPISQLKDSKRGQTAYILGTAPSLNLLDIEKLLKRESFWCNKAYNLEKNGLRFQPKYYFVADRFFFQESADHVMQVPAEIKFFRNEIYSLAQKSHPEESKKQNIITFESIQIPGSAMCDNEENFSYDPSVHLYSGWTVVMDAIQFAFYMGYDKVYVGGVDLDYQNQAYFWGGTARDTLPIDTITDRMRQSFLVARKHFERHGRTLAKITPSPHLPLEYIEDAEMLADVGSQKNHLQ